MTLKQREPKCTFVQHSEKPVHNLIPSPLPKIQFYSARFLIFPPELDGIIHIAPFERSAFLRRDLSYVCFTPPSKSKLIWDVGKLQNSSSDDSDPLRKREAFM